MKLNINPLLSKNPTISIYSVFQPIFYLSLLAGMTPFDVRGRIFKNNVYFLLWSVAFGIVCTILGVLQLLNKKLLNSRIVISDITDSLLAWANLSCSATIILHCCLSKDKILTLLEQLQTIDMDFENDKIIKNRKQHYRYMRLEVILFLTLSITMITYVIITGVITFDTFPPTFAAITETVVQRGTLFCTAYMLLQFCCFLGVLRQRYKWLNRYITITARNCDKFANKICVDSTLNTIQNYHKLLSGMCESLQSIYSRQLLVTIGEILLSYLSTAFFWIHILIKNDYSHKIIRTEMYFPYSIGLLLLQILQLVALVICCSKTAEEANKSGRLLHDIHFPGAEIQSQIIKISRQLFHNKVSFTGCNVFVINESLILSIIAATVVYLLVVFQFEISDGGH